jgi:hypothetical protein
MQETTGDLSCTTVAGGRGEGCGFSYLLKSHLTYLAGSHVVRSWPGILFPTRLLTSEDEYKWYWHQMIYFPETINTISTMNTMSPPRSLVSS